MSDSTRVPLQPGSGSQNEKPTGPLVFLDADNTIWDTDRIFADAQLQLLEAVEGAIGKKAMTSDRLAFIREVDQEIAHTHHLGLKYPPKLLLIALVHALGGLTPRRATEIAWSEGVKGITLSDDEIKNISDRYFETLSRMPELKPGVRQGLLALKKEGAQIVVLTEGSKKRVTSTLLHHKLMTQVSRVIEATKTTELFKRLLKLAAKGQLVVMIGDQISRDIAPAAAAGARTIHIPANFQPRWERNRLGGLADYELCGFEAVPTSVAKLLQRQVVQDGSAAPF